MPYPQQETLPNGADAAFASLSPRWQKLLRRKGQPPESYEPDALAVEDRAVRPMWAGNSNPSEISIPFVTQGRAPIEDTMSGQEPIAPPRPAFTPAINQDVPVERPRTVTPDLPQNRYLGSTMYPPDDSDLPVLNRNLGSSQFAPDLKTNPDYAGQGVQSPAGEAITRPKVVDKLGYAETHTPMPRHGRLYETGKGALLGFLGGVERTGTIGGGLGGAATLGAMSAFKPQYAEEAQNQMFTIPRLQQQEAIQVGRNETALKQEGELAKIGQMRSETYKNLHPQTTPHYETRANGTYVVDSQNPEGRLLRGVPGKPSTTRPKTEWIGGVLNAYDENGVPAPVMRDGKPVTSREKTPIQVKMSDGSDVWVTPAEALSADAVRGRTEREGFSQDVVAQNEQVERERVAKIAQDQADYQTEVSNRRDAQAALTQYNRTYRALQQNLSQAKQFDRDRAALDARYKGKTDDPNYVKASDALEANRIKIEEENKRLKDEADSAGGELTNNGIHVKYVRQLPSGYFELGPEIPRPVVPPAAQVQSRRMPVQSRRGASVVQPQGGKYPEAEVRRRATAAGKNPDEAVKTARANNLIQ